MEKPAGQDTGHKKRISDDEAKLEEEFRKLRKEHAAVRKKHLVTLALEYQMQVEIDNNDWWPTMEDSYKKSDAVLYEALAKGNKIKEQELHATNTQIFRWNTLVEKSKTRLLQCGPPMRGSLKKLQEKLNSSRD
jgi:hypothetical protein